MEIRSTFRNLKQVVRIGESIDSPSEDDLHRALKELFHEDFPGLVEGHYEEHPNTWLTYGFDDGPLYELDVYRGGMVIFSKYRDADYNQLEDELKLRGVTEFQIQQLWQWLASGDIERIRSFLRVTLNG